MSKLFSRFILLGSTPACLSLSTYSLPDAGASILYTEAANAPLGRAHSGGANTTTAGPIMQQSGDSLGALWRNAAGNLQYVRWDGSSWSGLAADANVHVCRWL